MGCRAAVAWPPPSAVMVAPGSSRATRAAMSLVCQAFLKSRMMAACRAVGGAGWWAARSRGRGGRGGGGGADGGAAGGGQLAAGGRGAADDAGDLGEWIAEHVVQDERDTLGGGHRFEHDQERHGDRLVEGDAVGGVCRGAG